MFVLGHLVCGHESRTFPDLALDEGEEGLAALLPDMISCHDWGYHRAWRLVGADRQADLIVAHMIGDAVVHFGDRWRGDHRKRGWAYRRMGLVTRRYDEFFTHAEHAGWRPAGRTRDSRRGWAHTLVEYSIDQWLADRRDLTRAFLAVGAAARQTERKMSWLLDLVASHAIEPSKPLATQPLRYCGALARARTPDEFHLRGLALKFGLREDAEVLDWLRGWLRAIWQAVGEEEMRQVLRDLVAALADPVGHNYPLEIAAAAKLGGPPASRWSGLSTVAGGTGERGADEP
jgi:hypothetical protein